MNRFTFRSIALAAVAVVASLPASAAAQRPSRPPRRAPAPPPPPARAALPAVRSAFRAVAAQPAVKTATRAEILRQLRTNRPAALIGGRWVTPIDMGPVYATPVVRAAVVASLGTGGPQLVDAAVIDPSRFGLVFTPAELGSLLLGDMVKDITASMGVDALRAKMTDVVGIDDIVVFAIVGAAVLTTIFVSEYVHHSGGAAAPVTPPYDPAADPDGDGVQNYKDDDDDGDGHDDEVDEYPDDPNRDICDCGRPNGVYFGRGVTPAVATAFHSALAAATRQLGSAVNVGVAAAGRRAAIRVVVP